MTLLPEGALEAIEEACDRVAQACERAGASEWEISAGQAWGTEVEIERDQIQLASGGGEGGIGVRILDGGRFGFTFLSFEDDATSAVEQALDIARRSPSIPEFALPEPTAPSSVEGLYHPEVLDLSVEDLMTSADELIATAKEADPRAVLSSGGVSTGVSASHLRSKARASSHLD